VVGHWQIVIILLVVLLLFGASRLGDIGKGLGEGIKNFKKGVSEDPDADAKKAEEPKRLTGKTDSSDDDASSTEAPQKDEKKA
jgi:sec-independent protein translocase protein TatA